MQRSDLLNTLAFDKSPAFLGAGQHAFEAAPAYGHVFRRAAEKRSGGKPGPGVIGVYTLRSPNATANTPPVPTLYVCRADSVGAADRAHRLTWNQDVVPFVVVECPDGYRLYSGFEYDRRLHRQTSNVLRTFNTATELAEAGFHADSIDDGALWRNWGREVRPEARVDWMLLKNLKIVDDWLRGHGLRAEVSHALIGKYVYLHYLRDRDILSDRKLEGWKIAKESIFGRSATLDGLHRVALRLDGWLNGSVFPLEFEGNDAPDDQHVQWVAATFAGDEPRQGGDWQLHLDFQAFDFSYIPIETLSVVYEQFLHAPTGATHSRGKEAGAYYTPIPVVNFMLAEMEDRKPLERGTRVLDPSCGSGAFLVQCYRRLVEKEFAVRKCRPRPVELRELLQRSVFGIDRDADACSVAELSLILTLLDYCDPPDLENGKSFRLPSLRDENIFAANFFQNERDCFRLLGRREFDWVIGNPPWKGLKAHRLSEDDKPVWEWMQGKDDRGTPIGGNEVAQAFAWEVTRYLANDGIVGLLMPAMALFEDPSKGFREAFFKTFDVSTIANFANLTEVLFAGRSREPAAALFYAKRSQDAAAIGREYVTVYSPLVANQEATRPVGRRRRNEMWSVVLNAGEVRQVRTARATNGSSLPWKLAIWGSHFDLRLLEKLATRCDSIRTLEETARLIIATGPQLTRSKRESLYEIESCDEVIDKNTLDVNQLKHFRRFFAFPTRAVHKNKNTHIRLRRGKRGLLVSRPPHIIVSEARNFAVYTDEYLIVPSGQIGIASTTSDSKLLKALTVYLNSEFAFYHQFLASSRLGVKRPVATISALRELPVPIAKLPWPQLDAWVDLHDRLAAASFRAFSRFDDAPSLFDAEDENTPLPVDMDSLLDELNSVVYEALELKRRDRALVEDLVRIRLELDDGKLGKPAVEPPSAAHLRRYAKRLKSELDGFIGDQSNKRHDVDVIHDEYTGMIQVRLANANEGTTIQVHRANDEIARDLERTRHRLQREHAQWVYFERSLRIFEGRRTFLLKPMQRFHWTESQAMADAADIIAETLNGAEAQH